MKAFEHSNEHGNEGKDLDRTVRDAIDDALNPDQFADLQKLLLQDASFRKRYVDHLLLDAELSSEFSSEGVAGMIDLVADHPSDELHLPTTVQRRSFAHDSHSRLAWQAIAVSLFIVGLLFPLIIDRFRGVTSPKTVADSIERERGRSSESIKPQPLVNDANGSARLVNASSARFYNELTPPIETTLFNKKEYVLTGGAIELRFPLNTEAIIESPAVFRILSDSELALDVGRCSIRTPQGVEGFRVETQYATIVDRGARFVVSVAESSETEVQVVKGNAEVYRRDGTEDSVVGGMLLNMLSENEAIKLYDELNKWSKVDFDSRTFRDNLPDRIVSYDAKKNLDGDAEQLLSVTVQRGGQLITVPARDLIHSYPIGFRSVGRVDPNGHLVFSGELPSELMTVFQDDSLVTGIINPGGQTKLSDGLQIIEDGNGSGKMDVMGLAVRFDKPVVNRAGPDIVLFELQTLTNPHEGDAFHVYPIESGDALYGHTVKRFDISMNSSEALRLGGFQLQKYAKPVMTLEELESLPNTSSRMRLNFRALATGIDLSDLGCPIGASIQGILIQDAGDDESKVDPVFIGGLP